MSQLLINEPPLQVLPSLAKKIGPNEAIVLQQLHYWLSNSKNIRNDRKWIYRTYEEWQETDFPFWSVATIRRTFSKLKKRGLVIVDNFNKMKQDKTKWYTINYEAVQSMSSPCVQNEQSMCSTCTTPYAQSEQTDVLNLRRPLTREYTENTQENNSPAKMPEEKPKKVVVTDEHRAVIDYLNQKANTRYTYQSTKTISLLNKLFKQGRTVDDIKSVIDIKCSEWLPKQDMRPYLRPRTLFGEKFEDYLNQVPVETKQVKLKPTLQERMKEIYGERWEEMTDG